MNGKLPTKPREWARNLNLDQTSAWLQNQTVCIYLEAAMESTPWTIFGDLV